MASETTTDSTAAEDMDLETPITDEAPTKRQRDDDEQHGVVSNNKKQLTEEKSVEEERMETLKEEENEDEEEDEDPTKENSEPVILGPKNFGSSVEMFDYFYKFLHFWPVNVRVNKYEYMVLLDLLKKGHPEPDKKIGSGVNAFEIRHHPMWKSRCFFVIRADETTEDFSFRKCVDHILPLPENIKGKFDGNNNTVSGGGGGGGGKRVGGGRRGGGRGRGRGRGRGGKSRR